MSDSSKDKLKKLLHSKTFISAVIVAVACLVQAFLGKTIDASTITSVVCSLIGCN